VYLVLVVIAALPTAALVGVSSDADKQELEEARRPLASPVAVAVAPNGTVYVADRDRSRLVTVAADGSVALITRKLKSFAYSEYSAYGVAVADDMTVIYADARHHCIRRISPNGEEKWITGGVATTTGDYARGKTGVLNRPVAVAAQGHNMLVCTIGDDRVWLILPSGDLELAAGNGQRGAAPDGTVATDAPLGSPRGVTTDARGLVVFSERWGNAVRVILADGTLETIAGTGEAGYSGDGGPAREATLSGPTGVAVSREGHLYIADTGNGRVRRVGSDGTITSVCKGLGSPMGLAIDGRDALYLTDSREGLLLRLDPDDSIVTLVSPIGSG
jgi:sugar lactone lactonase YvrE